MLIHCLNCSIGIFSLLLSFAVWASPAGSLDKNFGEDGKLITAMGKDYSVANAVIQQTNNKLVVAGVSRQESNDDLTLARYNNNGSLDTGFGKTGILAFNFGSGEDIAYALLQQKDSKLVAVGSSFQTDNTDFVALRLTAVGEQDKSFSQDGVVITSIGKNNDEAHAVLQQNDGLLVVAGFTESTDQGRDFALVRYTAAGKLDKNFDSDGIVTTDFGAKKSDAAFALLKQPKNTVLAIGYSNNGQNDDFSLARYTQTGQLDSQFGEQGLVLTDFHGRKDRGFAALKQRDGRIVVVGTSHNGKNDDIALARYMANGDLDISFGEGGKVITAVGAGHDAAYAVVQQYDGKLLIAGYTQKEGNNFDFCLIRYNGNGTLDKSFNTDGILTTSFGAGQANALAAVAQSNGHLVLAGFTDSSNKKKVAMARYLFDDDDNDGVVDDKDNCPFLSNPDQKNHDSDDDGDACDEDDDNDNIKDKDDLFPLDPTESRDHDGDGIGDNADTDDDNDGLTDSEDPYPRSAFVLRRIGGSKPEDHFAYSVANAGDLNQDGYDDMIVGIPQCDRSLGGNKQLASNVGCVLIYSGKNGERIPALSFHGAKAGDEFGNAVAGGVDIDRDSVPDLIVGAFKTDGMDVATGRSLKNAGMVYAYSGADGHELFRLQGQATGDGFGKAIALMPDIDADGYVDILVGAWKVDSLDPVTGKLRSDAGAAYVYSGHTQHLIKAFFGEGKNDRFGSALASVDLDHDGLNDVAIGAYLHDNMISGKNQKRIDAGAVYVYAAGDWGLLHSFKGLSAGDQFGFAISGISDLNADGHDDLIIGAPKADVSDPVSKKQIADAGIATGYSGRNGDVLAVAQSSLPQAGARFGAAITALGDINGDHVSDFAVGAFKYTTRVKERDLPNAGQVSLLSGADASQLFMIQGQRQDSYLGFALSGGGDQNQDGVADIIIGGHKADPLHNKSQAPILDAGSLEVISGRAGLPK